MTLSLTSHSSSQLPTSSSPLVHFESTSFARLLWLARNGVARTELTLWIDMARLFAAYFGSSSAASSSKAARSHSRRDFCLITSACVPLLLLNLYLMLLAAPSSMGRRGTMTQVAHDFK